MEISGYRPRVIDERLNMYLRTFGAVCVEGPKWCGKTWTSRKHSASEFLVASPAKNFQNRKLLEIDINAAFAGASPHLIDEWQEFPELWDATRAYVDESNEKGRYILTGSSTPKRKGVMHSGTGRIASLRMRPMTLWESGESDGLVSFRDLCENRLGGVVQGRTPELKDIAEWIVRGGWPESIGVPIRDAMSIPREYITQVENNDIHRIDETRRDVHKVDLLLRSLARNEATAASLATLCNDITEYDAESVDPDTVSSYLNALSRLFVIDNQKPFHANARSKVSPLRKPSETTSSISERCRSALSPRLLRSALTARMGELAPRTAPPVASTTARGTERNDPSNPPASAPAIANLARASQNADADTVLAHPAEAASSPYLRPTLVPAACLRRTDGAIGSVVPTNSLVLKDSQ